jgi:hypothetical protein
MADTDMVQKGAFYTNPSENPDDPQWYYPIAIQCLGSVVTVVWSGFWTWVIMEFIFRYIPCDLNIQIEMKGLDLVQIGEVAYQKEDEHLSYHLFEACKSGKYATVLSLIAQNTSSLNNEEESAKGGSDDESDGGSPGGKEKDVRIISLA